MSSLALCGCRAGPDTRCQATADTPPRLRGDCLGDDGSVSGTIGDAQLIAGRFASGRGIVGRAQDGSSADMMLSATTLVLRRSERASSPR